MPTAKGLEVTIMYRGTKYDQVAAATIPSSVFAILKKDLTYLRVHSPSQDNVRRVDGSFILHWPAAGMRPGTKVVGLAGLLHTQWVRLCSDDPEVLKLREFLSIESIMMEQEGILIRATASKEQASQDALSGMLAERLGHPLQEARQHVLVSVPTPSLPMKPPPTIPPTRFQPFAPRLDRLPPPHLKRRMSGNDIPSNSTQQKQDMPEVPTTPPLQSVNVPSEKRPYWKVRRAMSL